MLYERDQMRACLVEDDGSIGSWQQKQVRIESGQGREENFRKQMLLAI